ncbi:MAG: 50S ribosomal protein L6 [Desulfobulbaceae bacterium]|nr:50S ribosomal protein L6 [Candidatus Kapabacteria bacterium]MBS4000456.1 50S ribosomal protein L6 [Desulfobulbaceae bacterium]
MSRIGKMPIPVPPKVQLKIDEQTIRAKGPLGELEFKVPDVIKFKLDGDVLTFDRGSNEKHVRALHGLSRALTANIIEGVSNGFTKTLIIEGVGFRAELKGDRLLLTLGFSHTILVIPPPGITFELGSPTNLKIKGIDKQLVGMIAAKIRKMRPPEPYKGKGVRYEGEFIRRKAGKTSAK